MLSNEKAAPEYANSKTAVWWDMDTCPVPDGYDAGRVRPIIEGALKELGYYGPVTITAMGNLKEATAHFLQRLSSTGIVVQHAITDCVGTLIFSDLMEFKSNNLPPATIMLISDKVDKELSFPLGRNQQIRRGYNIVRARSFGGNLSPIDHTADWRWKILLDSVSQDTTTSYVLRKCSSSDDSSALSSFLCRACNFTGLSVASFTSHLSTEEHKKTEKKTIRNFSVPDFSPFITAKMNDQAAPEYVNSKTAVWWDMDTCPVPDGYDARRVRPSIEGALKDLGYCGPVTITAMGNLENAHPHVLQGLSSTRILVQHTRRVGIYIYSDLTHFKAHNPPPATIMLISDRVEHLSLCLSLAQQSRYYYNLVLARTYTPGSMSRLYHTAEWLWQTLLARSQETTSYVLRTCTASGDSASSFFCKSCDFTGLSVTDFTSHLSSEEHKQKEIIIFKSSLSNPHNEDEDSDEESMTKIPKRKRSMRVFRTTHVLLFNRRPTRRGARRGRP